jgi:hypothetical protein
MDKRGEALFRAGDDVWRAIPVLNVGGMRDRVQHVALGIGEDMTLAALDLLARIIAARSAAFRGFHALAVDHTGCRLGQFSCVLAQRPDQPIQTEFHI